MARPPAAVARRVAARTALVVFAAAVVAGALTAAPAVADPADPTAPAPTPSATSTAAAEVVDLTLTPAGSTAAPRPTQRGTVADFGFVVQGVSPDATLSVALPAALTFTGASEGNATIACTPATGTVVCPLGTLSGATTVVIGTRVEATTPVGTRLRVTGTVTPVPGPDANPTDNTTTLGVVVSGHLELTQTAPDSPVLVAAPGDGTFTYALHDTGPEAATGVRVTFRIFGTDAPLPSFADFGTATVVGISGARVWEVGTIPAGGTATLQVTLHASGPVHDSQVTWDVAYDAVPTYCFRSAACASQSAEIRSVPGGPTGVPPVPHLAATGTDHGPLAAVGLGLVLGGAVVTRAGRRRRL